MRPLTTCWTSSAIMSAKTAGARVGRPPRVRLGRGPPLLGGGHLPELGAGGDGHHGILAVLDLGDDDVAVALPVLIELVEAVEAARLQGLERRHDLGRRR